MDDGLKQRIIGALVLLAIAIIFVPVFFDQERIVPLDRTTQVPLAPEIEPIEIEKPIAQNVQEFEPAVPPETMYIPDEEREQPDTAEEPKVSEVGVPEGWVLQVASYRHENHAKETRDKLIAEGFSAYTKNVETSKGVMTRLYVGPKLDKTSLLEDKKDIDKKYGVDTILLRYEP